MNQLSIIRDWNISLRTKHRAHTRCAALYNRRNLFLGVSVVALSAISGTTVLVTLQSSPETWIKILVGLFSIAAAVLAGLQRILPYAELSQKHKTAAEQYGSLRKELEVALAVSTDAEPCTREFINSIRTRWDTIEKESPSIPQRIFDLAANTLPASSK